jgi:hypothetical protein
VQHARDCTATFSGASPNPEVGVARQGRGRPLYTDLSFAGSEKCDLETLMRERPLGENVYGVSERKGIAVVSGFFTIVSLCAVRRRLAQRESRSRESCPLRPDVWRCGPLSTGHWPHLRRRRSRPMVGPRTKIAFIRMPT